jgi:cysteine desulfurase
MTTRTKRAPARRPDPRGAAECIYLDHNATTPLAEEALEAMMPYLVGEFGNAASRTHAFGQRASAAVEKARQEVAELCETEPRSVVWTSGATEANNLAIKGVALANRHRGEHIVTQATEHPSVLDAFEYLRSIGFQVTVVPCESSGRVDLQHLTAAITDRTTLVSIMYANNETGVIQPVAEAATLARAAGAVFHCDATQAVGRIPVDMTGNGIDLLSCSAHKVYGPKGVGALCVANRHPRISLVPLLHGGGHERGFRSGTPNVPGIVGFGAAAKASRSNRQAEAKRLQSLRERLETALVREVRAKVNGAQSPRLPNTSSVSFDGVNADGAIVAMPQLALSTGSACTSASVEPSHVLTAMGLPDQEVRGTLRISLGRSTTLAHVDAAVASIIDTVQRLRALRLA